jgi:hypothetical protein
MVIACHLIWTAYGSWLPNDPRGSGSRRVVAPQLVDLGVCTSAVRRSNRRAESCKSSMKKRRIACFKM